MTTVKMPTTLRTVSTIERIRSSKNGNPRFRVTFTDGSVARTKTDTAFAYELTPEWEGKGVLVMYDARGYIVDMWREGRPLVADRRANTGCYLDGHHGWRNIVYLVEDIAVPLGYELSDDDAAALDAYARGDWQAHSDASDAAHDIADDAERWLNDHTSDGYLWHWQDGEFFLSPYCGNDDECDNDECACHAY